ncbi:MAG: hypothetical protein AAF533_14375 [Acidobacteriota bacterium]
MLFFVWGASGSGKTTAMRSLQERLPDLVAHDFDEVGVPAGADQLWRHRAAERWLQVVLEHQSEGRDVLLTGQLPHGELLACPSADQLDGIASCLLDCTDVEERFARIRGRERGTGSATPEMAAWAQWMRGHARDPQWHPEVITEVGAPEMCWERWTSWPTGDPRWRVEVIDNAGTELDETVERVLAWIVGERERADPQSSTS